MAGKLFVVGVGPGSSEYLTDIVKYKITKSRYIAGYSHTLSIIRHLLDPTWQRISEVTIDSQDDIYKNIFDRMETNEYCTVPFTGDVNFSESEVIDRLLEIFGEDNVEMIPGISSIQVASSKSMIPLDKATIITFHVTGDIEEKKLDLVKAVVDKKSIILVPRPWPSNPSKNFMPSEISLFLKENEIDTSKINVWIFENLTNEEKETVFRGKMDLVENKKFSDLSVMVIDQNTRQT